MALATRELELVLIAKNRASSVIARVGGALAGLSRQAGLVGAAGAGAMALMVTEAAKFQQQTALTFTQVEGVADATMKSIEDATKRVARRVPVEIEQVQSAFYDLFSTVDVANINEAEKVVEQFARAAVVGQAPIEDIARNTIAWVNALDEVLDEQNVRRHLNIQFEMVRKGAGTYAEMTKEVGKAIPAFVKADQSAEAFAGTMAFLTRRGLNPAFAATSAARAVELLYGRKAVEGLSRYGIALSDVEGNTRHMVDVLRDLEPMFAGKTVEERVRLFYDIFGQGRIQARRFFDTVLPNLDAFEDMLQNIEEAVSEDVIGDYFELMADQPLSQIQQLQNHFKLLRIEIGQNLWQDIAKYALPAVKKLFVAWEELPDVQKRATSQMFLFGTALAFVVAIGAGLLSFLTLTIGVISAFPVTVGLAILALTGLSGAILNIIPGIIKNWEGVKDIIVSTVDSSVIAWKSGTRNLLPIWKDALVDIAEEIDLWTPEVEAKWTAAYDKWLSPLVSAYQNTFGHIKKFITGEAGEINQIYADLVRDLAPTIVGLGGVLFGGPFTKALGVGVILSQLGNIGPAVRKWWNEGGKEDITTLFSNVWGDIRGWFTTNFNFESGPLAELWDSAYGIIRKAVDFVVAFGDAIIGISGDLLGVDTKKIEDMETKDWKALLDGVINPVTAVLDTVSSVLGVAGGLLSGDDVKLKENARELDQALTYIGPKLVQGVFAVINAGLAAVGMLITGTGGGSSLTFPTAIIEEIQWQIQSMLAKIPILNHWIGDPEWFPKYRHPNSAVRDQYFRDAGFDPTVQHDGFWNIFSTGEPSFAGVPSVFTTGYESRYPTYQESVAGFTQQDEIPSFLDQANPANAGGGYDWSDVLPIPIEPKATYSFLRDDVMEPIRRAWDSVFEAGQKLIVTSLAASAIALHKYRPGVIKAAGFGSVGGAIAGAAVGWVAETIFGEAVDGAIEIGGGLGAIIGAYGGGRKTWVEARFERQQFAQRAGQADLAGRIGANLADRRSAWVARGRDWFVDTLGRYDTWAGDRFQPGGRIHPGDPWYRRMFQRRVPTPPSRADWVTPRVKPTAQTATFTSWADVASQARQNLVGAGISPDWAPRPTVSKAPWAGAPIRTGPSVIPEPPVVFTEAQEAALRAERLAGIADEAEKLYRAELRKYGGGTYLPFAKQKLDRIASLSRAYQEAQKEAARAAQVVEDLMQGTVSGKPGDFARGGLARTSTFADQIASQFLDEMVKAFRTKGSVEFYMMMEYLVSDIHPEISRHAAAVRGEGGGRLANMEWDIPDLHRKSELIFQSNKEIMDFISKPSEELREFKKAVIKVLEGRQKGINNRLTRSLGLSSAADELTGSPAFALTRDELVEVLRRIFPEEWQRLVGSPAAFRPPDESALYAMESKFTDKWTRRPLSSVNQYGFAGFTEQQWRQYDAAIELQERINRINRAPLVGRVGNMPPPQAIWSILERQQFPYSAFTGTQIGATGTSLHVPSRAGIHLPTAQAVQAVGGIAPPSLYQPGAAAGGIRTASGLHIPKPPASAVYAAQAGRVGGGLYIPTTGAAREVAAAAQVADLPDISQYHFADRSTKLTRGAKVFGKFLGRFFLLVDAVDYVANTMPHSRDIAQTILRDPEHTNPLTAPLALGISPGVHVYRFLQALSTSPQMPGLERLELGHERLTSGRQIIPEDRIQAEMDSLVAEVGDEIIDAFGFMRPPEIEPETDAQELLVKYLKDYYDSLPNILERPLYAAEADVFTRADMLQRPLYAFGEQQEQLVEYEKDAEERLRQWQESQYISSWIRKANAEIATHGRIQISHPMLGGMDFGRLPPSIAFGQGPERDYRELYGGGYGLFRPIDWTDPQRSTQQQAHIDSLLLYDQVIAEATANQQLFNSALIAFNQIDVAGNETIQTLLKLGDGKYGAQYDLANLGQIVSSLQSGAVTTFELSESGIRSSALDSITKIFGRRGDDTDEYRTAISLWESGLISRLDVTQSGLGALIAEELPKADFNVIGEVLRSGVIQVLDPQSEIVQHIVSKLTGWGKDAEGYTYEELNRMRDIFLSWNLPPGWMTEEIKEGIIEFFTGIEGTLTADNLNYLSSLVTAGLLGGSDFDAGTELGDKIQESIDAWDITSMGSDMQVKGALLRQMFAQGLIGERAALDALTVDYPFEFYGDLGTSSGNAELDATAANIVNTFSIGMTQPLKDLLADTWVDVSDGTATGIENLESRVVQEIEKVNPYSPLLNNLNTVVDQLKPSYQRSEEDFQSHLSGLLIIAQDKERGVQPIIDEYARILPSTRQSPSMLDRLGRDYRSVENLMYKFSGNVLPIFQGMTSDTTGSFDTMRWGITDTMDVIAEDTPRSLRRTLDEMDFLLQNGIGSGRGLLDRSLFLDLDDASLQAIIRKILDAIAAVDGTPTGGTGTPTTTTPTGTTPVGPTPTGPENPPPPQCKPAPASHIAQPMGSNGIPVTHAHGIYCSHTHVTPPLADIDHPGDLGTGVGLPDDLNPTTPQADVNKIVSTGWRFKNDGKFRRRRNVWSDGSITYTEWEPNPAYIPTTHPIGVDPRDINDPPPPPPPPPPPITPVPPEPPVKKIISSSWELSNDGGVRRRRKYKWNDGTITYGRWTSNPNYIPDTHPIGVDPRDLNQPPPPPDYDKPLRDAGLPTQADVFDQWGYGASGAIVTKPTLSLIGEAGPEAVIPLNRMEGASPLPSGDLGGGTVVHNHFYGDINKLDEMDVAEELAWQIRMT